MDFDSFIHISILVQKITLAFSLKDKKQMGIIQLRYEEVRTYARACSRVICVETTLTNLHMLLFTIALLAVHRLAL